MTDEPKTVEADFNFHEYNAFEVMQFERATGFPLASAAKLDADRMPMDIVIGAAWIASMRGGPLVKLKDVAEAFQAFAVGVKFGTIMDAMADEEPAADPTEPPPTAALSSDSAKTSPASVPSTAKRRKPSAK